MPTVLDDAALDLVFRAARSHRAWLPDPVPRQVLVDAYDLARMAPTSANCSPMRLVFVASPAAKERLRPCLSATNVAQTMAAPVTAIVAHDTRFHDLLPRLFREADARAWFADNAALAHATAVRNGTLQGAYFMLAARACGLDCGPMSGFDNAKVDATFFADGRWRSNFLCNLGFGDPAKLAPRDERLAFDEACAVV